jgi:hypothetical protein
MDLGYCDHFPATQPVNMTTTSTTLLHKSVPIEDVLLRPGQLEAGNHDGTVGCFIVFPTETSSIFSQYSI